MLEILTSLLTKSIEKIFGMSVDIGKYEITKRRKLLSKLISLYESLEELEKASTEAYKEFISYASGTSTPTKLIIKNRLSSLDTSYKKYASYQQDVNTVLSIYDNDLSITLQGGTFLKRSMLARVNLVLEACPKMVTDDGKSTFFVKIPTSIPDVTKIQLKYPMSDQNDLDNKADIIRDRQLKEFQFKEIDMRNKENVGYILHHARSNIDRIKELRIKLGQFIKNNVPLESILNL